MKFSITAVLAAVCVFPSGAEAFVNIKSSHSSINSGTLSLTQQQRGTHCKKLLLHATATPRTGIAQQLLNIALQSPLWDYVLVPQARASIVKTAEENGIPWVAAKEWLMTQNDAPWNDEDYAEKKEVDYPEYYTKSFHAYSEGNLSYDAAFEQELAR